MTIVRVIDFETTGLDLPAAEVCEVGICDVDVDPCLVGAPRSWLCGVKEMPPAVRAVHHISKAECDPHTPFQPETVDDGVPSAFAAHNAGFEMKFFAPSKPMICTYKVALRAWPEAPTHTNGGLRYWLEDRGLIAPDPILAQPAHRAGPDAYVTAWLLVALLNAGITGKQMVEWSNDPAVLPTCPIGKFRGKPWPEVEGGFLHWMLGRADMDPDLKWNARREIDRRTAA